MQTSKSATSLWDNANRRNNARIGIGDRADALHKVVTIKSLIRRIGTDPDALALLAERQHEMTDSQRTAALRAACPPTKEPKVTKAAKAATPAPKAAPPALRRMADVPLRGFHQ